MVTPAARREASHWIRDRYGLSERRACRTVGAARSTVRYRAVKEASDSELKEHLTALATLYPRYGYRRLHQKLRRAGLAVNHKRCYRVYTALGLAVRRKRRNRVAQANRLPRVVPVEANHQWSMDFMRDTLSDGRGFRLLNIIDDATDQRCLA